jgi:hypothetical protein
MKNIFKNPILNSIYAEAYIIILVSLGHLFAKPNTPDKFFDPVVALSLFVLSAAVMGYLFLGEPLQLFLSGEKKQAVSFFMKTVLSFAVITLVITLGLTIFS